MRRIVAAAAVLAAMLATGAVSAQSFPPHRFFGRATVDGRPVPAGTVVRAFVGPTECGRATVVAAGQYRVDVLGATVDPGCGRTRQSTISFRIGDAPATQTATYRDGGYERLDLAAPAAARPAPTPARSPTPTPTPAPTASPTAAPATPPSPAAAGAVPTPPAGGDASGAAVGERPEQERDPDTARAALGCLDDEEAGPALAACITAAVTPDTAMGAAALACVAAYREDADREALGACLRDALAP